MSTELKSHEQPEHGTFKSYVTGFILSVVLTVIPFGLVMNQAMTGEVLIAVIWGLAIIQIFVQLVYFLHMNRKSDGGWNMVAFLFTLVIILILVIGSLWIMYHLNHNVMPH